VTASGFAIEMDEAQAEDVKFNWQAFEKKNDNSNAPIEESAPPTQE